MDHDAVLAQILNEFPVTKQEAEDILAAVGWEYQQAKQTIIDIYGEGSQAEELPKVPEPKPVITPKAKGEEEEKFVLAETNEKFTEKRKIAQDRKRWLLVHLSESDIPIDPLKPEGVLRDFMNCRFIGFTTSTQQPDGKWFSHAYRIHELPVVVVLDPVTGEFIDQTKSTASKNELSAYLRRFLFRYPKYGLPVDYLVDEFENEQNEEDEEIEETAAAAAATSTKVVDPGQSVCVMVQTLDGKKTKIEIGENELINVLYQKVSVLANLEPSQFNLNTAYPHQVISDMKKSVKECKLKNSLINVTKK